MQAHDLVGASPSSDRVKSIADKEGFDRVVRSLVYPLNFIPVPWRAVMNESPIGVQVGRKFTFIAEDPRSDVPAVADVDNNGSERKCPIPT